MKVLCRVFVGGRASVQIKLFEVAFAESIASQVGRSSKCELSIEYLTTADIKIREWDFSQLCTWLLSAQFYFILNHPHQGVKFWDCRSIAPELARLEYTVESYPTGDNLKCPIFVQDKYEYIKACRELCIPTFRVRFPVGDVEIGPHSKIIRLSRVEFEASITPRKRESLTRFLDFFKENPGCVLKPPFCTNGEGVAFIKAPTLEKVIHRLGGLYVTYGDRVFYYLVQMTLSNRKEYKVVLHNGVAKYVSKPKRDAGGTSFSTFPHTRLFAFAENALQTLHRKLPGTMREFLVRVDVMETMSGRFVVNEFESFEALYDTTDMSLQNDTDLFLKSFWFDKITKIARLCV